MKKHYMKWLQLAMAIILTLQVSCKKDKDEESFVDDYNPSLTEASGTSYTGDYYPLASGYYWTWSGTAKTTGNTMGVPMDESESVSAYMSVGNQQQLTLSSGTYTVFPTTESEGLQRYFEKTNSGVNLRAMKNAFDSNITEIKNPIYIKNPLVVGDKWETQPEIDQSLLEGYGDMDISNLKMNCKLFVVGKENMQWKGNTVQTLKLDERAEVTGSINYSEGGYSGVINLSIRMTINLNLLKDVGIISQKMDIQFNISGLVKMELNVVSTLTLTDYSFSGTNYSPQATLKSVPVSVEQKIIKLAERLRQNYCL